MEVSHEILGTMCVCCGTPFNSAANRPILLPCCHDVCEVCYNLAVSESKDVNCNKCNQHHKTVSNPVFNITVMQFAELVTRGTFTEQQKEDILREHKDEGETCKEHNMPFEIFEFVTKAQLCENCIITEGKMPIITYFIDRDDYVNQRKAIQEKDSDKPDENKPQMEIENA